MNISDNVTFGNLPIVKRLMKGFYELKPAIPQSARVWDVNVVLCMLEAWWPLDSLTLKELTLKLVMLTALLTGQRCQTLHAFDLNHMMLSEQKCIFFVDSKLKHSRKGVHQAPIELLTFPESLPLCVVNFIQVYIKKTCALRGHETKLFISWQKPHRPVSKDSIARWIKIVLERAGLDLSVYSAHSTRAASTSHASNIGVSVSTILNAAGWSSESTFAKFYKKTPNANFGSSIVKA